MAANHMTASSKYHKYKMSIPLCFNAVLLQLKQSTFELIEEKVRQHKDAGNHVKSNKETVLRGEA